MRSRSFRRRVAICAPWGYTPACSYTVSHQSSRPVSIRKVKSRLRETQAHLADILIPPSRDSSRWLCCCQVARSGPGGRLGSGVALRAGGRVAVQPGDGEGGQDGFDGQGDQGAGGEAGGAGEGQPAGEGTGTLNGSGGEQADAPGGGQAGEDAARWLGRRAAGDPGPAAGGHGDQGPRGHQRDQEGQACRGRDHGADEGGSGQPGQGGGPRPLTGGGGGIHGSSPWGGGQAGCPYAGVSRRMRRATAWSAICSRGPGQGKPGALSRSSTRPCSAAQTWAASHCGSSPARARPACWQRLIDSARAWKTGRSTGGRSGSPVGACWLNRYRYGPGLASANPV